MRRIILLILITLCIHPLAFAAEAGDDAPDFVVKTLTGDDYAYSAELKGKKPAYLMLWATW